MKLNGTEVRSFLVGNILGDGNLHNGAFLTAQVSLDLVKFKHSIFKRYFGFSQSKITFIPAHIRNGVSRQDTWRLYVSPNKYLKKAQAEMYTPKKVVTQAMLNGLCPLGLAIWFADDGTTTQVGYNQSTGSARGRRVQLCTDAFTKQEVEMIQDYFIEEYGKASVVPRGKGTYRVQLGNLEAQKFLCDISLFFIEYFPSLLYKLDMGYRGASLDNRTYVTEEYSKLYSVISSHPDFVDRMKAKSAMI